MTSQNEKNKKGKRASHGQVALAVGGFSRVGEKKIFSARALEETLCVVRI